MPWAVTDLTPSVAVMCHPQHPAMFSVAFPTHTHARAQEGIQDFLDSHKCNSICAGLRLPRYGTRRRDDGTQFFGTGEDPQQAAAAVAAAVAAASADRAAAGGANVELGVYQAGSEPGKVGGAGDLNGRPLCACLCVAVRMLVCDWFGFDVRDGEFDHPSTSTTLTSTTHTQTHTHLRRAQRWYTSRT